MSFGDAGDAVGGQGAEGAPHGVLVRDGGVGDRDGDLAVGVGQGGLHIVGEVDCEFACEVRQ